MPKPRSRSNRSLPKFWRVRNHTYYYRVPPHLRRQFDGKTEISLGQDLSQAYQTFSKLVEQAETLSRVSELLDRYVLEVVTKYESANTRDSKERSIARLRHSLGDNYITDINSAVIYTYQDKCAKAKSETIANRDIECISHVFTKAVRWGLLLNHPFKGIEKFKLEPRRRYVEDWELAQWATVANPFLVVYVGLKGATGLRQQDLLTIKKSDITETELHVQSLKVDKRLRFPLYTDAGKPTSVKRALDAISLFYKKKPLLSPWLFYTRSGTSYYDMDKRRAPGFKNIWQRSMKKAIAQTELTEPFREHDLRAKVASDLDTDREAQEQLAHSSADVTRKHYRRRGTIVRPAKGFLR